MEVKITTCLVCGNRYFQDDYPECPVCAGSIKRRQGETEAMTDREYDMNGSATLPLHTPETERRAEVKTEADVGKTLPPDHVPQRSENWKRTSGDMGETRPPYDVKVGTKPPKPDGPNEGGQTGLGRHPRSSPQAPRCRLAGRAERRAQRRSVSDHGL